MKLKKYCLIILISLIQSNCSSAKYLNKKIDNSQRAVKESMSKELDMQFLFREKYINDIIELAKKHPKNPIIIVESYDFMSSGGPAVYVRLYNDEILIKYRLGETNGKKIREIQYKKHRTNLKKEKYYIYNDLMIIYDKLKSKKQWNANPDEYDDKTCFDGANTIYSVYHPNKKIESMYIRCWIAQYKK